MVGGGSSLGPSGMKAGVKAPPRPPSPEELGSGGPSPRKTQAVVASGRLKGVTRGGCGCPLPSGPSWGLLWSGVEVLLGNRLFLQSRTRGLPWGRTAHVTPGKALPLPPPRPACRGRCGARRPLEAARSEAPSVSGEGSLRRPWGFDARRGPPAVPALGSEGWGFRGLGAPFAGLGCEGHGPCGHPQLSRISTALW